MRPPPPSTTLFPYTTLFRSEDAAADDHPVEDRGGKRRQIHGAAAGSLQRDAVEQHQGLIGARAAQRERRGLPGPRSEEHTSELQSRGHLVCRLLPEKKKLSR